jgi:hypothetical protein
MCGTTCFSSIHEVILVDDTHMIKDPERRASVYDIAPTICSSDGDELNPDSDGDDHEWYFGPEMPLEEWGTDMATVASASAAHSACAAGTDDAPRLEFGQHPQAGGNVRPLSRNGQTALAREVAWRELIKQPKHVPDLYLKAIPNESDAWQKRGLVRQFGHKEAQEVLRLKIAAKRFMGSRIVSVGIDWLHWSRSSSLDAKPSDVHTCGCLRSSSTGCIWTTAWLGSIRRGHRHRLPAG